GGPVPNGLAEHAHRALAGAKLAGGELQEGRFARAVGPEQARYAGQDAERELVDADDVAVPLRDAVEFDDGVYLSRSSDFTRDFRIHKDSPKRPASTPADQYQGYCGPATAATATSALPRRANTLSSGRTTPLVSRNIDSSRDRL